KAAPQNTNTRHGHPRHWLHPHGSRDNFLTHFCTDEAADLCDELTQLTTAIGSRDPARRERRIQTIFQISMQQRFSTLLKHGFSPHVTGTSRSSDHWCQWFLHSQKQLESVEKM
ncbi:hypothetical protein HaLaN_27101, partial [Haematococcus lacustris]